MKRLIATFALAFVAVGSVTAQQDSGSDIQDIKQELREAVSTLRETRDELHASQQEIEKLRTEVASLRASLPQASPSASVSDIPDKVQALQDKQGLLSTRLDQQYQTKVESGSKYRVRLSGLVLFNASSTRGTVDDQDVPMLAEARPAGSAGGNISATMRQTLVNLDVFGPEFAGARTSASMQFDFFGGFPSTLDGVAMGIARLRVAHAQLDWTNWSLTFGQDQPFISPNSPTSLATIGTPGFGYSGNLWTWTPQIVAARKWSPSDSLSAKLQFGVLDPFSGQFTEDSFSRYPEAGELSRTPAFAARQSFEFGSGTRKSTIGAGGYFARQDYTLDRIVDSWAGTLDWNLMLGPFFEVSGELYRGHAIGGMWGGIGTSAVFNGNPNLAASQVYGVNTIGGWSQVKYKPASKWEVNGGFGEDSPFASDLRHYNRAMQYAPYLRNWTTMFNVIEHPRSNLMLSLEYRHLNTIDFTGFRNTADHVNLGVGVSF